MESIRELSGKLHEFMIALDKAGFKPDDIQKIVNAKDNALAKKMYADYIGSDVKNQNQNQNQILSLLSANENLVIKATTGKRFLAFAKNTFQSSIDSDFKNWDLNKTSHETTNTPVHVYELVDDGTFAQIFGKLSNDLDKLCLTQDQIEEFCIEYRSWLRKNGYGTFFLFKENNHFFVAYVYVNSDGLGVRVYRLESDDVWYGRYRHCVVVPQL